jgi:hypothetical protein
VFVIARNLNGEFKGTLNLKFEDISKRNTHSLNGLWICLGNTQPKQKHKEIQVGGTLTPK